MTYTKQGSLEELGSWTPSTSKRVGTPRNQETAWQFVRDIQDTGEIHDIHFVTEDDQPSECVKSTGFGIGLVHMADFFNSNFEHCNIQGHIVHEIALKPPEDQIIEVISEGLAEDARGLTKIFGNQSKSLKM